MIDLNFELFFKTVQARYRLLFQSRVTLNLTEENVRRAYEVYKYGVNNMVTLSQAVKAIFGYRYRRMENFVRELGIYMPKLKEQKPSWLHVKVLIKIKGLYEETEKRFAKHSYDFELITYRPFHLNKLDRRYLTNLFAECFTYTDFRNILVYLGELDFQYTNIMSKGLPVVSFIPNVCHLRHDHVIITVNVQKSKHVLSYEYHFNAIISLYSIWEFLRNQCKETLDIMYEGMRR